MYAYIFLSFPFGLWMVIC